MRRARTEKAKDERRQAFLNAALEEFFINGFAAARMDDIASRAGFTKGSLYLYFDSKEILFKALIETVALPNIEHIETIVANSPTASDAIQALMTFASHLIRKTHLPKALKILISNAAVFPELASEYRRKVIDRGLTAITVLLEKSHAEGVLHVENPQLTARLVIAPVIFSAVWKVAFETDPEAQVDLDELLNLHGRLLMRALRAETGEDL